jgi:NifU-like protein involved in Fe-S cluster formation
MQVLAQDDAIVDARFTADACALCIAAASVLTERARGLSVAEARRLDVAWLQAALEGAPPAGRQKCVTLPLETLQRAIDAARTAR